MSNYSYATRATALSALSNRPSRSGDWIRKNVLCIPTASPAQLAADYRRMEKLIKPRPAAAAPIRPALTVTVNEHGASFFGSATPAPVAAPAPTEPGFFPSVMVAPVVLAA